jgi:hypothetical protein
VTVLEQPHSVASDSSSANFVDERIDEPLVARTHSCAAPPSALTPRGRATRFREIRADVVHAMFRRHDARHAVHAMH